MIRVPSPQDLRRPRSAAQVMSETTAFFAANPSEALRFGFEPMLQIMMPTPGPVAAPRRTPGGRISRAQYANAEARKAGSRERRRATLAARREALGITVVRTPSGRITRAKYPTPEARRAGALVKLRATLAVRRVSNLIDIVIPISDDVYEIPGRPSLSAEERQARRTANMN